ncbi:MAG: hypothetical protein ACKOXB_09620 [Flavobacteriales bacterium]
MKLTKAIKNTFFNLVKEQEKDTYVEASKILYEFPELSNAIVSGLSKGIDGFSSLMLAIRFSNFKIAVELIELGADINYIDTSHARTNHQPVFFDLLESIRDLIEAKNVSGIQDSMKVWTLMESKGLDYSLKSITNDGVNKPKNCLEKIIQLASANVAYGQKHRIHFDVQQKLSLLSENSRDLEKEKWYELVISKIVNNIEETIVNQVNADDYRSSSVMQLYNRYGKIDQFALEVANKFVFQRFRASIKNIDSEEYIKENYQRFLPIQERK